MAAAALHNAGLGGAGLAGLLDAEGGAGVVEEKGGSRTVSLVQCQGGRREVA